MSDMKCEQYTCIHHTVLGCGKLSCICYAGLHNEINAAAPENKMLTVNS